MSEYLSSIPWHQNGFWCIMSRNNSMRFEGSREWLLPWYDRATEINVKSMATHKQLTRCKCLPSSIRVAGLKSWCQVIDHVAAGLCFTSSRCQGMSKKLTWNIIFSCKQSGMMIVFNRVNFSAWDIPINQHFLTECYKCRHLTLATWDAKEMKPMARNILWEMWVSVIINTISYFRVSYVQEKGVLATGNPVTHH